LVIDSKSSLKMARANVHDDRFVVLFHLDYNSNS
jgi:hypothetical protein